jgi:hypothetical protein
MSANVDTSFFGIHEDIILTKEGVWLSNQQEVTHEGTLRAFFKNIFRCKEGFEIRIGNEHKVFHAEDTIYFVRRLEGTPAAGFTLELSDGRSLPLDPTTIQYRPGRLTCRVYHPNDNTHEEAKFLSAAYYELLNYIEPTDKLTDEPAAEPGEGGFVLTIQGLQIKL